MVQFSGSELVEVAVTIERAGIAFYNALAERARDEATRSAYLDLARMEGDHLKTFQGILDTVGRYQPFEAYAEEHALYLSALAGSAVFADDKVAVEMAQRAANEAEAIQIAIGAEKDSILFYSEMRDLTRERERPTIDRIVQEEKSHLRQLSDMKRRLAVS